MARKSNQISQREQNETRLRRAESWLELSKKSESDDEKFIFLWIAFNAAYGAEIITERINDKPTHESTKFKTFLKIIVKQDKCRHIKDILWVKSTYFKGVKNLLGNEWIYEPYWQHIRSMPDSDNWQERFLYDNKKVREAMSQVDRMTKTIDKLSERQNRVEANKDYIDGMLTILTEVFMRLYTLRNQMFHGGTTFASGLGRKQIEDGSYMMSKLVPVILDIMREDIEKHRYSKIWGLLNYPRAGDPESPETGIS